MGGLPPQKLYIPGLECTRYYKARARFALASLSAIIDRYL